MGSSPVDRQGASRPRPSAAQLARRRQSVGRWLRRGVQLLFFILAPAAFSGAFNGIKYLFTQIGLVQGIELTSFLVLLIAMLVVTIAFGRFFCGYACAFGTLGDYLYSAFEFLRSKTSLSRPKMHPGLVKALSFVKFAVLAGICIACALGAWSGVSGMSPWVAFAAILSGSLEGVSVVALVLFGLVVAGMIVRERFFCQFLCPLGAVFSLMPVLGFSAFTRIRAHCARNCGRCQAACPVDIWPDSDRPGHGECIACGRCADACPMGNVNLVAIERPDARAECLEKEGLRAEAAVVEGVSPLRRDGAAEGPPAEGKPSRGAGPEDGVAAHPLRKTRKGWRLLRGTEPALVVAKAAILLVVLWAVSATRYLPTPGELMALFGIAF